jgi:hypoxanthine phosphoribosyltransferase
MYDSGNSMAKMLEVINSFSPKSLKTCVLMHKRNPDNKKFNYFSDYIGFFVPDLFVVGYGLDYNEELRHLPHVCEISQKGIEFYKK